MEDYFCSRDHVTDLLRRDHIEEVVQIWRLSTVHKRGAKLCRLIRSQVQDFRKTVEAYDLRRITTEEKSLPEFCTLCNKYYATVLSKNLSTIKGDKKEIFCLLAERVGFTDHLLSYVCLLPSFNSFLTECVKFIVRRRKPNVFVAMVKVFIDCGSLFFLPGLINDQYFSIPSLSRDFIRDVIRSVTRWKYRFHLKSQFLELRIAQNNGSLKKELDEWKVRER